MNKCVLEYPSIRQSVLKRRVNPLCIGIAIIVYCLNKLILMRISFGPMETFFRCYLNDLVCPLLFLGYCQILLILIDYEFRSYKSCLLLGMSAGIVWEYFAPVINPKAVSDPWDLLCYFGGSSIYFMFMKIGQRRQKMRRENRERLNHS